MSDIGWKEKNIWRLTALFHIWPDYPAQELVLTGSRRQEDKEQRNRGRAGGTERRRALRGGRAGQRAEFFLMGVIVTDGDWLDEGRVSVLYTTFEFGSVMRSVKEKLLFKLLILQ